MIELLDWLYQTKPKATRVWRDRQVQPISGGHNNLIYRATSADTDVAVKFTKRDAWHRAQREYNALFTLHSLGLQSAPEPVLIEPDRYPLPVVVQSWEAGVVCSSPPVSITEWESLLNHLTMVHTVTPANAPLPLTRAVLNFASVLDGFSRIEDQLTLLPNDKRPAALQELVTKIRQLEYPLWPEPQSTLCHGDPNPLNIIRRPNGWLSVDWENSGWGDPAFELADLMAHPGFTETQPDTWGYVIGRYDFSTTTRI